MTVNEIIKAYKTGKMTVDEANKALDELDAGFSLNPEQNNGGKWTEDEMKEGFFNAEPKAYTKYPEQPIMKRIPEFAGLTITQKTKIGQFDVKYDELGYAVKSTKVGPRDQM